MEFILKGKGWPSKDYRRKAETKKTFISINREKQYQETEERKQAKEHHEMLKEEGRLNTVDFLENPNAKEIIKIGKEVKHMKRCGEARTRIDRELEPEMDKLKRIK